MAKKSENMDISIITVTWNSKQHIAHLIKSVRESVQNHEYEHIIVDNASQDDTALYIQDMYPDIRLIANTENKGFGAANEQGFQLSIGKYILFLNPDMSVQPHSLDVIIDWFEKHPDIGIAGCKLINEDGSINENAKPRRFPTILNQLAVLLKLPHLFPWLLASYKYADLNMQKEHEVDSVRGSFFLVRREFIQKVGFAFDPRYFIWFEEVDMCREAKRHGYKVVYTPIISAVDMIGQSFEQQDSMWKQKQFTKSMLTYFQKWSPWYQWIWIWLARPIAITVSWISNKVRS